MIRAMIVDDEPLARTTLRLLLAKDAEVELIGECGSGAEAIRKISEERPSLVFLDVQMPECDGFEVMEALAGKEPAAVVFVTAYDQYAIKAFEVAAVDYLLKPFDNARFQVALLRAKEKINSRGKGPERLIVRSAGRVAFVALEEVDWIEGADYCVSVHAGAKTHVLRRTLSELERELEASGFCRVHRSAIVNLSKVSEIRNDATGGEEVLLKDGARVRLSKGFREKLFERMAG